MNDFNLFKDTFAYKAFQDSITRSIDAYKTAYADAAAKMSVNPASMVSNMEAAQKEFFDAAEKGVGEVTRLSAEVAQNTLKAWREVSEKTSTQVVDAYKKYTA